MLKKIYKWTAILISISIGVETHSLRQTFYMLFYFIILYLIAKIFSVYLKNRIHSAGGPLKWFLHAVDTTRYTAKYEKGITEFISNLIIPPPTSEADYRKQQAEREAANQRAFNRTRAQNEAAYHQYYANKYQGTYDGWCAQNRADNARERAKRY